MTWSIAVLHQWQQQPSLDELIGADIGRQQARVAVDVEECAHPAVADVDKGRAGGQMETTVWAMTALVRVTWVLALTATATLNPLPLPSPTGRGKRPLPPVWVAENTLLQGQLCYTWRHSNLQPEIAGSFQ
jgi:hypothetical protein